MTFFRTARNTEETQELFGWSVISGVTTNPLITKEAPDARLASAIALKKRWFALHRARNTSDEAVARAVAEVAREVLAAE